MKSRCLTCEYGYNPISIQGSIRLDAIYVQGCSFGLEDGAAPVGEICPMDGKKLKNCEI